MLNKLILRHFKCFEEGEINFRNLTVLAGSNSVGKSSVIQSILLSKIAVDKLVQYNIYDFEAHSDKTMDIPLNGKYMLSLGTSREVLTRDVSDNIIRIELHENQSHASLSLPFRAIDNRDDVYSLALIEPIGKKGNFDLLKDEFYYLNAERIGPRLSYDVEDLDYVHVGWQGEYTIQVISQKQETVIEGGDLRKHPDQQDGKLINQIRSWMNDIIPGFYLDFAKLEARVKKAHTSFSNSNAPNVGFGISYVLPIVVNALMAKEGKLFIIENPEVHLHPKGQSQLGQFLAKMAGAGVQIIIETHSEHIINGIRVGSLIEGVIPPTSVLINFFNVLGSVDKKSIVEIEATDDGDLTKFPRDFFDQVNQDMAQIYRLTTGEKNG